MNPFKNVVISNLFTFYNSLFSVAFSIIIYQAENASASSNQATTEKLNENIISPLEPDTILTGYASVDAEGYVTTTGGQGGTVDTIATLQQLVDYAKAREELNVANLPKIVIIKGKFESPTGNPVTISFKHGSNLTLSGLRKDKSELKNVGFSFVNYKNLIVRNMFIHEVEYPEDGITLNECNHVWIDHCELHSKMGSGITQDTYDGLLDIKNGSRYVTISWNYLHDHMKCSLIGHSDDEAQEPVDQLIRVTYYHNYFRNTDARNPSIRFGAVHMFNNYFENISDYGIAARDGSHAKIENNHFESVDLPMSTDKFPVAGLPNGYICESNNLFTGTCGANIISQTDCDFWNSTNLPYQYTPDPVNTVADTVKKYAGIPGAGSTPTAINSPRIFVSSDISERWSLYNYPNPATNYTNLAFSLQQKSIATLSIYDLAGRLIKNSDLGFCLAGYNEVEINISDLKPGIYIIQLKSAKDFVSGYLMIK
jgi:pectate lyase